jgi:hypothetical protein
MKHILRRGLLGLAAGCALLAIVPPACAAVTANLLVNGDAETHLCTDDWTAQTPTPGWTVVRGAASVACWSGFSYMSEVPVVPTGGSPGKALFASPGIDTSIEQIVDVSAAAEAIDKGQVAFSLSGWLGGWRDRPEHAVLTAIFLHDERRAAGAPVVVDGAGPEARHQKTALLKRAAQGTVPPGTRRIAVSVDFPSGMSSFQNAFADNLSLTLSGDVGALAAAPRQEPKEPKGETPPLDHVFVVMMENTNYADIVHDDGRSASIDARMPFLASLTRRGVLLTDMWAAYHPSDQNYVAMVAGDTYKYGPVYYPDYDLAATHLGDLLDAQRRSWSAYVQNMKAPCNLNADSSGAGWYAPDDQPFAQFHNVVANPARCLATMRDLTDFRGAIAAGKLPNFAWIAADGWWDGEGAWQDNYDVGVSLQRQDQFLQSTFAPLLASPEWKKSRSLLVVTWDESLGWGWPDNHIATVLVGSPGLLREGTVDRTHYDAYGVLRTIESAFGLPGFDRFDRYATPLSSVFKREDDEPRAHARPANPVPAPALATRGSIAETFGRVATPASAERGQKFLLIAPDDIANSAAVLAPLGRAPDEDAPRFAFDAKGAATIPTDGLAPGYYGAWRVDRADGRPVRAPIALRVLPAPQVSPRTPGVEIVDAPRAEGGAKAIFVREGANTLVRYCRPSNAAAGDTWIGVFPAGTAPDQLTQANALSIGYWLKTPGDGGGPCGEAMASASELPVNAVYNIYLLTNTGAAGVPIGRSDSFTVTPALPH